MSNEVKTLIRIEGALRKVGRRIFGIEKRLAGSEKKDKDAWDKVAVVMPLLQALLLALVGYYLTESVNQALRERELELSNVKEMRDILVNLYAPNVNSTESAASALALTAFGRYAVAPLIFALEAGTNQNVAAERSLRALGTSRPDLVCGPVVRILENRRQGYSVEVFLSAVRLAKILGCRDAVPGIITLQKLLQPGPKEKALLLLKQIVSMPTPTEQNLVDLRGEIDVALRELQSLERVP